MKFTIDTFNTLTSILMKQNYYLASKLDVKIKIIKYYIFTLNVYLLFFYATAFDEPDYKHILYGGVWKHVVSEPSKNLQDIDLANKVSLKFTSNQIVPNAKYNVNVQCLNKAELWYSESGFEPLLLTELISYKNGQEWPISIPVSFGTTYNTEIQATSNNSLLLHFVTLTKTCVDNNFFVYSHIYRHTDKDIFMEMVNRYKHLCFQKDNVHLTILSSLSIHKNLLLLPNVDAYVATATDSCIHPNSHKNNYDGDKSNKTECTAITIMTFNIWNFNTYLGENTHYPARMEAIGKLLNKANPDIIAFQEVRFQSRFGEHLGPSQMDFLSSQLKEYQFIYQPAQLLRNSFDGGRTEEGVAIFSKFPIIHHDYILLFRNHSNSADKHQRVCLHAVIDLPHIGKSHVYNTHLSLSHEAREESVKQIMHYLSPHGSEPVFLLGDLNATPEEKAIKLLSETAGLTDVWQQLKPSHDGFTYNALDELTKRIDYIFMKKTENIFAINIEILSDNKRSDAASDHRALQATFTIQHIHC